MVRRGPLALTVVPNGRFQSVDAVLPVTLSDLEWARLLLRSLRCHASGLRTLWVVTPASDLHTAEDQLGQELPPSVMRVIAETDVVPELLNSE